MAAKFSFATGEVLRFILAIKKEFHKNLRDNNIVAIWREDADYGHYTQAVVVPPAFRFMMNADAVIYVNKPAWMKRLSDAEKAYWIDHALAMLETKDKWADDGRPMMMQVQPEKIGYANVIARHGLITPELKMFGHAMKPRSEDPQMNIFEVIHETHGAENRFEYGGYRAKEADEIINDPTEATLYRAAWLAVNEQSASVELFQERLDVDYPVAVMLMNQLEAMEFIGPSRGNFPREILATPDRLQFLGEATGLEDSQFAQ